MKRVLSLLLGKFAIGAFVLGSVIGAQASIVFTSDTTTELKGSWLGVGASVQEFAYASAFSSLLPNGNPTIGLIKSSASMGFGTLFVGTPDNPFELLGVPAADTDFADYGGLFTNNSSQTTVYFLFSDQSATAGSGGTFRGDFCFSTRSTGCTASTSNVPEPGSLALLGLGIAGLAAIRKRKQA